MKPPSRRTLLIAAAALAVGAGLLWMLRPAAAPVELVEVSRGPMEVWVEDLGRTRVREVYVISAPVAGSVERRELEAGDPVAAGQTVVRIRPAAPALIDARTRRELAATAEAAAAAVALAEAELRRARAGLAFARAELARGEALAGSGVLAPQALEQRRLARDTAAAAVETAAAAVTVRRRELDGVRSRLAEPEAARGQRPVAVAAPAAGRVLRVMRESEQVVQAGEPILQIGDPGDMDVMVELLSTEAVQVRPGAAARLDGWGGPPLPARVARIEPSGFTKVSALGVEEQRVRAYLDFEGPESAWLGLGHDFRVNVRIVVWSSPAVVQVPASALFRQGADWAVYRVDDGRVRLVRVTIGHRNEDVAEVLEGLAPGDRVVAYPGDRLADGVRIRRIDGLAEG